MSITAVHLTYICVLLIHDTEHSDVTCMLCALGFRDMTLCYCCYRYNNNKKEWKGALIMMFNKLTVP